MAQTAKKLTKKAAGAAKGAVNKAGKAASGSSGSSGNGGQSKSKEPTLHEQVMATIKKLQAKDPGLKKPMKDAHGYVVFPSVGKAALVVGGAYGRGEVFEQGKMIGHATIGQLTLGVQIGGDTFSELIVFETEEPFERFKESRMKFAANASAVLVKAGAAATNNYEKGAQTFVYSDGGMLLELGIGGQKLRFKPGKIGEEDKDDRSSKGKASKGGGAQAEDDQDEESGDEAGEEEEGDEGGGMMSKLGAAKKGFSFFRNHPFLAAVVGAGVTFYAVSRLMSGSSGSQDDEDESEEDYDDEDGAQGSYDDEGEEEDQDEDSDEDEQDEEDEDRGSEEDEEDEASDEDEEDEGEEEDEDEESDEDED